jgi:tetratricopeptide (TPR) repeat protein
VAEEDRGIAHQKLRGSKSLESTPLIRRNEFDPIIWGQIDELATLLQMASTGTLVISICNPPILRKRILRHLRERLSAFDVAIYNVEMNEKDVHIVRLLRGLERSKKFRGFEERHQNVVFSVIGIERAVEGKSESKASRIYQNLNLYRDFFVDAKHPVILWVNDAVASEIVVRAPDFWRARTKVVDFRISEEEIIQSLGQLAGLPTFYKDLEDIKRRERIHQRLLKSLDPNHLRDRSSYAAIALSLGSLKIVQGKYDEARELCEKVLRIAKDEKLRSTTLHQLAMIHQYRGEYDMAVKLYKESLEIKRKLGDQRSISVTLQNLGIIHEGKGEYDEARKLYEQSLEIKRKFGDNAGIASSLGGIATIQIIKGNYGEAEKLYEQILDIFRKLGDREGESITLHQLAMIHQYRGEYDMAVKLYKESLEIKRKLGEKRGISYSLHQLATIEQEKGNLEEAIRLHKEGLKIDIELGDKSSISKSHHALAMIEQDRGNYKKAEKLYKQSLEINRKLGDQRGLSAILHNLGTIHEGKGEYDEARKLYEQSLEIGQKLGDQHGIATSFTSLGRLLESQGKLNEAVEYYKKSLEIAEKLRLKPQIELAKQYIQRAATKKR